MMKTAEMSFQRLLPIQRMRSLSTVAQTANAPKPQTFRTQESNPAKHSLNQEAQFYKIPGDVKKRLFAHGGIPKSYDVQAKTFNELCLMVREPAVDIIASLKSMDYTKPCVRFVLYGKKGAGKTLTLAQILHFGHNEGFLLVHVPWVGNWMRRFQESSNSETKEGFTDLNLDAATWLLHFKNQNSHLLENPELKVSEDVTWSKRESTPKDAPLLSLIEHGINRVKYASDCVVVLAKEIKKLANAGKCKVLVAVDGYNAFFYPKTRIRTEKREIVHPKNVTLTEAFLELTKFDWRNSAAVVTVDEIAIADEDQISHLPRYLLGKEGFEHLDPFVPVLIPNYNFKELISCLEYYKERMWIQQRPGQDDELAFLSGCNPYKLMQLCNPL